MTWLPAVLTEPEPGPEVPERLRARLVAGAEQASLLDVAYRRTDTPIGSLLLAATERGLVRVAFDCEDEAEVLASLAERVSPRILRAPARLDGAARQIDDYLAGRRRAFDLPLDLRLARGFRSAVLAALRTVPYGATTTYAHLAAAAGSPAAVRAAGTACATNPLPIVVPCHRVVCSDGGVGRYLGGVELKRRLLTLEAGGPAA